MLFMRNLFQNEQVKYLVLTYCVGVLMLFVPVIYMHSIGLLSVFLASTSFMAVYIGIASLILLVLIIGSYKYWKGTCGSRK